MVQGRFGNSGNRATSKGGKARGMRRSGNQRADFVEDEKAGVVVISKDTQDVTADDNHDELEGIRSPAKSSGRKSSKKATSAFNTRASSQRKYNMPSKICVICGLPFDWRKKWEDCWDEVTTCSKSCNNDRRILKRVASELEDPTCVNSWSLEERRRAIQSVKVENRQRRDRNQSESDIHETHEGNHGEGNCGDHVALDSANDSGECNHGQNSKACEECGAVVDFLVHCQRDASRKWLHLCDTCWPEASGGELFVGDDDHPFYVFGSVWVKSRQRCVSEASAESASSHSERVQAGSDHENKRTPKKGKKQRRRVSSRNLATDGIDVADNGSLEFQILRDNIKCLNLDDTMDANALDAKLLDAEFFGSAL